MDQYSVSLPQMIVGGCRNRPLVAAWVLREVIIGRRVGYALIAGLAGLPMQVIERNSL